MDVVKMHLVQITEVTQMHDSGSVQPSAAVRFQLDGPIFAQIEDWRRSQTKIPSRPAAIRELLKRALSQAEPGANAA
jgi:hypothetical protein